MDDSDIAILIFTLAAFTVMLLMCLWKTRTRAKPEDEEKPWKVQVLVEDHYTAKAPKKVYEAPAQQEEQPVQQAPPPVQEKQRTPLDYGEAQTAPVAEVQSKAPKIIQEEAQVAAAATMMDKAEAKKKILWLVQRWRNRKEFKRSVKEWKAQEASRRKLLTLGKAGSLNVMMSDDMEVKGTSEGGAAAAAGVMTGDVLVLIKREGRGGRTVSVPMPRKVSFLRAVGPQSEVFEGSEVEVVVIRDPAEIKAWRADGAEVAKLKPGTAKFVEAWLNRVEKRETVTMKVKVGTQTEGVRRSRRTNLEKKKKENNLTQLDIDLVDDFLSDPDKCAVFVRKIFNKADTDGSGQLDEKEIHGVFTQMTDYTGVKPPTEEETAKMFRVMDESYDQQVSFEEFFPYFRTTMVKMLMDQLLE